MTPLEWPAGSLAVVGTTAVGKSSLGLQLAERLGAEIVSVDSMQVYRGMDIGTAKPTPAERAELAHHLIDLVDPAVDHTVAHFRDAAVEVAADLHARGRPAVLVGGTGLYVRAIVEGLELAGRYPEIAAEFEAEADPTLLHQRLSALDPLAASRIEPGNHRRLVRALEVTVGSGRPFSSYGAGMTEYPPSRVPLVGLRRPRPEINEAIERRLDRQLADGFVEEVAEVRRQGWGHTAAQALGYRELARHLDGHLSLQEARDTAVIAIRQFARRQERWFRRDPRIEWIDATEPAKRIDTALAVAASWSGLTE